tara:strand:- start:14 stop:673 length:660 start_codon:yes stop_codon:yes gene_type:complete
MTPSYVILSLLVLVIFLFIYFIITDTWIKVVRNKENNSTVPNSPNDIKVNDQRRDFLQLSTLTIGGLGVVTFMWPFVKSMNPAEDTLALGSTEVDVSTITEGQSITVKWRGKPVFIRKRTQQEIDEAINTDLGLLPDPIEDSKRVQKPEWLVLVGVCTHLGCVPLGQKVSDIKGDYNGWYCPCHGSHYDTSGRIRKGPAPENLSVPPYEFLNDTTIKIG